MSGYTSIITRFVELGQYWPQEDINISFFLLPFFAEERTKDIESFELWGLGTDAKRPGSIHTYIRTYIRTYVRTHIRILDGSYLFIYAFFVCLCFWLLLRIF
jgi:hypothetical protein